MSQPLDREETLFAEALALPAGARREFLARACADDAVLLARVEALLQAHEGPSDLLNTPPAAELTEAARDARDELLAEEAPGTIIGRYTLIEKLGEGGCGIVYLAEQSEPVRRRVALKVIKLGMDTREVIARFEAERQALALMNHPNIARVFDAGATTAGRPFFVMEFVAGQPITKFCDAHQQTPEARLALFITVCHAVQHAHQKGVIHRDLKPSNILVTQQDGVAVPKVIDFGIAKATEGRLTNQTFFTAFEHFIGTPAYMSPEQAGLGRLDIDTRSDIYSLGVLLYELLTGRTPFDAKELHRAGVDEIRRRIREVEPPRPSTLLDTLDHDTLSTAARSRQLDPPRLAKLLRGDLDWIVMRCLEKDRTRRYETANGLAMDLQRHLGHEPVVARPPSRLYLLRKFVRRHKFGFAAATAIGLALVLGLVASTWEAVRATRAEQLAADRLRAETAARREAERQKSLAEQERNHALVAEKQAQAEAATNDAINDFLQNDLLAQASPENEPDRDVKLRTVLDRAAKKIEGRFAAQPLVEAGIRETLALTYQALGDYAEMHRHYERSLALRRQHLGPEHPDTLRAMSFMAGGLYFEGKFKEAQALAEQTLALQQRVLGPEHRDTLVTMDHLSGALERLGKPAESAKLLEEALAISRRTLGVDSPDTLKFLQGLGNAYWSLGRPAEMEVLLRQLLEQRQRVLGREHPDTLNTMSDLAASLNAQGKFVTAEALHRETLAIRRRVLGPESPEAINSMNGLAVTLRGLGKYDEMVSVISDALALRKKVMGPEHPETLATMSNLATAQATVGKLAEAEALHRQLVDIRTRLFGPEHPDTLRSMSSLANTLTAQGRLPEAETLNLQALEIRRRVLAPDHPDTLRSMFGLATTYAAQKKDAEAAALFRETLAARTRKLGSDHPDTLQTAEEFATVLLRQRAFADVESVLRPALTTRKKSAPTNWRTLSTQSDLAAALAGQKKFTEAEPLLLEAWTSLQKQTDKIPAANRAVVSTSAERLAQLYTDTAQPEKAAEWLKQLTELAPAAKP